MYTQQFRQPPRDYGGTAISKDREEEETREEKCDVPKFQSVTAGSLLGGDELLIAVIIMIIMSGNQDKNTLLLIALVFILL